MAARRQLKDLVAECKTAHEAGVKRGAAESDRRATAESDRGATAAPHQQQLPLQWSLVGRRLTAFTCGILGVIARFQKVSECP